MAKSLSLAFFVKIHYLLALTLEPNDVFSCKKLEGSPPREAEAQQADGEKTVRRSKRDALREMGNRVRDKAEAAPASEPPVDQGRGHGPCNGECLGHCKVGEVH